jgi:hypothetical protein
MPAINTGSREQVAGRRKKDRHGPLLHKVLAPKSSVSSG